MRAAARAERRTMTAWLAMVVERHLAGDENAKSGDQAA
jgi:hypothetical protein